MVPWTHLREPRLGRLLTVLMAEFTHFNPVIRLSKVKQPAFFRVSPVEVACWTICRRLGPHFFSECATDSRGKPSFFQLCSRDRLLSQQSNMWEGYRHVLFLQVWSFLGILVRSNHCALNLINEPGSCLHSMWVDRMRSRRGVTHDLCISELNPCVFCFVSNQLGPHWSLISCVLPRSR